MNRRAFSLVELLAVLAILVILGTLSAPAIGALIERGRSAQCMANLRQIGVAVQQYATDHDYRFPAIETDDYELGNDGQPASVALAPYGITRATLTCPTDLATTGNIKAHGCSYHFSPRLQDELLTNVNIYGRRGIFQVPNVGRLTVCSDYQAVHSAPGRLGFNLLKADGRVIQR